MARKGGRRRPARAHSEDDYSGEGLAEATDPGRDQDPDDGDGDDRGGGHYDEFGDYYLDLPQGRLGPLAGIGYAVTAFVGSSLLVVGDVRPDSPSMEVAQRLVDQRGSVSAGVLLTLFSAFFMLIFVAYVHRWLRAVEGDEGWLATLALVAGAVVVACLSMVALLSLGGTILDGYGEDPAIARTLLVLSWQAIAVVFLPTAAFLGATSLLLRRSEVIPSWMGLFGLVLAAGLILPPLAFLPYLLSAPWIGMLAVMMLTRNAMASR